VSNCDQTSGRLNVKIVLLGERLTNKKKAHSAENQALEIILRFQERSIHRAGQKD
jgi:hypothetical protein